MVSNEVTSLYLFSYLIVGLIYGFLALRQEKIYQRERLRASLWYTVFFASLSIFYEFTFFILLFNPELETTIFLVVIILSISFLVLAATSMIARERIGQIILGLGLVVTVVFLIYYFILGLDAPLYSIVRVFILLYNIVLSVSTVAFFLYLAKEFKSGKALGFSLGISGLIIAGMIQRVDTPLVYDMAGLMYILAAISMVLGFFGIFDQYIFNKSALND